MQNAPYILAKLPPEIWMGIGVIALEYIKPKHPSTNVEPLITEYQPLKDVPQNRYEEGWQWYRYYGGYDVPPEDSEKPPKTVNFVTKLPTVVTHSPPDISGMDIYTALQVMLLFAIASRNIKINVGV